MDGDVSTNWTVYPQRFYLVPNALKRIFIQLPSASTVLDNNVKKTPSVIRWFAESSPENVSVLVVDFLHDSDPVAMGDPNHIAIVIRYSGIGVLDLEHGQMTTIVEPIAGDKSPEEGQLTGRYSENAANRIIFGYTKAGIVGYDTTARAILQESAMPVLALRRPDVILSITPTPNLTSIAAVAFHSQGTGRTTRHIYELFIYDLTPYPKLRELEFGVTEPSPPSP